MNKVLIAAIAALALLIGGATSAEGQSAFSKGDKMLSVNYTLGRGYVGYKNDLDYNIFHGVMLNGEYGIVSLLNDRATISAGAILGFQTYSEDILGLTCSFSRVRIATRGTFHYSVTDKLDTYGGINFLFVDLEIEKIKGLDTEVDEEMVGPALVVGTRYMFTDRFGANIEFSWDPFQLVSAGLSFKL